MHIKSQKGKIIFKVKDIIFQLISKSKRRDTNAISGTGTKEQGQKRKQMTPPELTLKIK